MRICRRGSAILAALCLLLVAPAGQARAQSPDDLVALNTQVSQLFGAGKLAEAAEMAQRAVALAERLNARDDVNVAVAFNNLAFIRQTQGRYSEAEPFYKRGLPIMEKILPADHAELATTRNGLAELYRAQGRFAEAEPLYRSALAARERTLGPDHADVAVSLNNIALLYQAQGRYPEAEALQKRGIAIMEKSLGSEHPAVATLLNNLAELYRTQGRFAEAEPVHKRALAIREKALGTDHADVGQSLNNLALLNHAQSRYAEAEPLYKRTVAILEKALGPEHPSVAVTLNNLGELYRAQGRYAEAEPLHKRALAIREKALGPDHADVGQSLNNVALLLHSQGRLDEAEPLYRRALAIMEKALGADHPGLAVPMLNLAELYRSRNRQADADKLFERVKAIPKSDVRELAILFGTNRRAETGKQVPSFGSERSERLLLGRSVVVAGHEQVMQRAERMASGTGMLDKSGAALTVEKTLAIRSIVPQDNAQKLFAGVRPRLQGSREHNAFVFVHGYNVGFEDALKRTAQIAFDLDFSGTCLLFTWPSRRKVLRYGYDRESADIATNYLIEFLDAAAREMPNTRFHFIAHSMGNVVLLSALEKMAIRGKAQLRLSLGEIILAHPDVDRDRFKQLATSIRELAPRMTLYTSKDDWATWVSKIVAGAGRAGGERIIVPGVETIDISGLGNRLWSTNHNVYSSNPLLFGDMSRLIARGSHPPDKRSNFFEAVTNEQGTYWRYKPPATPSAAKQ